MKGKKQLQDYQIYKNKRKELQLPSRLQQYFSALEDAVENAERPATPPSALSSAFSKLNPSEQTRFLNTTIDFVDQALKAAGQQRISLVRQYSGSEIPMIIETTCQSGTHNPFKMMCAPQLVFKLNCNKQQITLSSSGANRVLDVHHYLVTKVSDKKIRLIPAVDQTKFFHRLNKEEFSLPKPILANVYEQVFAVILKFRTEELLTLISSIENEKLKEAQQPINIELNPELSPPKKNSDIKLEFQDKVFLSRRNFKHFLKFKVLAYKKIGQNLDLFTQLPQILKSQKLLNVEATNSTLNSYLFRLQAQCAEPARVFWKTFVQAFDSCNKNNQIINRSELVLQSELLEELYEKQYQAVYEKYLFQNAVQQMIFIKEFSAKPLIPEQKNQVLFIKAVQNIIVVNFLSFLSAKIQPISSNSCKLTLYAQFNQNEPFNQECALQYLQDFIRIVDNAFSKKISKRSSYRFSMPNPMMRNHSDGWERSGRNSVRSETEAAEKQIQYEFGEPEEQQELINIMKESSSTSKKSSNTLYNFAKTKFRLTPVPEYDVNSSLTTKHYLEDDWTRSKKGGMLCLNQTLLNEHKKIFKYLITSIGSNVLKGNNVLNVSLPVTIFKKQSHLQMLAKSFSMAPRLFEGVTDSLQRMKRALILMISVGNLGISIEKPFYPHLGETLQVWIAGCPMYLEQITRYPPTGAYLFKGRGYDIHGQVEPRIGFGLNSGKGYSERPSYIKFEDGNQIEVSYGKLVVNGLFVGQRQFNFQGKMFAYDRKNNLFLEANYGPKDTRFLGKSQQPEDYIYGSIYQTSPEFGDKFDKKLPRPYPKDKQIRRTLSTFEGIWNSVIQFDGQPYFDFSIELPSLVIPQENSLPSDCRFRKDLRALIQGDMEEAQREKTALEEGQRRDRKLRKEAQQ